MCLDDGRSITWITDFHHGLLGALHPALGQGPSFQGLGDLPGGIFHSQALGVSADGSVVVGWARSASGIEAFRWTPGGGMVGLGDLPGGSFVSQAWGVSADGSVVVGFGISASGQEAFRWTAGGGMVGLGDLPGGLFHSQALGVSADGSVVVGIGSSASGDEAFRWTQGGGMVGLGDLAGGIFRSVALGVSADGSVVVGYGFSASGQEAFIWDQTNGMRSLRNVLVNDLGLDLTGWTLTSARGVSDDGRVIVGSGRNPSGDTEAWMATLPLPCTEDAECDDGNEFTVNRCADGVCQPPVGSADLDRNGTVDLLDFAEFQIQFP